MANNNFESHGFRPSYVPQPAGSSFRPSIVPEIVGAIGCSRPESGYVSGRHRVVIVGCDYHPLGHFRKRNSPLLRGAVNDAKKWKELFVDKLQFPAGDVKLLEDSLRGGMQVGLNSDTWDSNAPTRKNIFKALHWLIAGAQKTDVRIFVFCGMGGCVDDSVGYIDDGYEECIVPCDYEQGRKWKQYADKFQVILTRQVRDILASTKKGVNTFAIMDCDHGAGCVRFFIFFHVLLTLGFFTFSILSTLQVVCSNFKSCPKSTGESADL